MNKETEKHILRRYLDGSYLKSETDELHQALRKEGFQSADLNELADEVWHEEEADQHVLPMAQADAYQEAKQILRHTRSNQHSFYRRTAYAVGGIAATLLLVFGIFHLYHARKEAHTIFTQITTSYGERKQITLADGSKVVLNACSSLQYPDRFTSKERKVNLQGEAFFQIARNEKQPFLVETEDLSVKVLGTEFNVKAYTTDDQVSVDVESGKVEVTLPEATLRLKKQERIWVNTVSGEFNKKQETENKVAVWREGGFVFHCTPIQDVARELERAFHCRIEFAEGQEFNNVVTGELSSKSLKTVLESIRYVCGINYRMKDDHIILYKE